MLGRNSWIRPVPLVPRYVALTVSDAGRSRWMETCQLCADPMRKSGSTANVFSVSPGGRDESVGERERILGRVGDAQRARERRLLRHQRRDRLIDVRVAVDPVSRAHDDRRSGHRSPRDGKTRLQAAPVRPHQRRRETSHPMSDPVGSVATTGLIAVKPGRDIQVDQASEPLAERRLVLPARTSGDRQRGTDPPVVGDVARRTRSLADTCRRCRRRSGSCSECRAGSRRSRTR